MKWRDRIIFYPHFLTVFLLPQKDLIGPPPAAEVTNPSAGMAESAAENELRQLQVRHFLLASALIADTS